MKRLLCAVCVLVIFSCKKDGNSIAPEDMWVSPFLDTITITSPYEIISTSWSGEGGVRYGRSKITGIEWYVFPDTIGYTVQEIRERYKNDKQK
jgi:hypothetical protein